MNEERTGLNIACPYHDIVANVLTWRLLTITQSFYVCKASVNIQTRDDFVHLICYTQPDATTDTPGFLKWSVHIVLIDNMLRCSFLQHHTHNGDIIQRGKIDT